MACGNPIRTGVRGRCEQIAADSSGSPGRKRAQAGHFPADRMLFEGIAVVFGGFDGRLPKAADARGSGAGAAFSSRCSNVWPAGAAVAACLAVRLLPMLNQL